MNNPRVPVAAAVLVVTAWIAHFHAEPVRPDQVSILGNPDVLQARYAAWKQEIGSHQPVLVVPMSGALTPAAAPVAAEGEVRFDLRTGAIEASVSGLDPAREYRLWLLDQPVDTSARRFDLGALVPAADGLLEVAADVHGIDLGDFRAELVAVAPADGDPIADSVLIGSLALFQRLYLHELAAQHVRAERARVAKAGIGFEIIALFLGVPDDFPPTGVNDTLSALAAKGEFLFFNETFQGNGRTCGTCHPAENNLTLDAKFISQMPNKDPLFKAEFDANLNSDVNGGRRFEIPELMRKFAVILENLDGFGDLKKRFTMRGIPHVFAQGVSIKNPQFGISPPKQRTGWGGDGSPFGPVGALITNGSLRDFSVGAVRQHFPKTLNRVINVDFVLPTPAELDAMEAFMLSLGRQADLDLGNLILTDVGANQGLQRFQSTACGICHGNAGANVIDENLNFDTGVEEFLQNRINDFNGTGQPRPVDGGFGTGPNGQFPDPPIANADGSFGDRTFNVPSLVEAADTPPFFHANIADTIEDAVEFYRSPEFVARFGNIINATDVPLLGRFLRAINAIDNIENSALRQIDRAIHFLGGPVVFSNLHDVVNRLLRVAVADLCDVLEVCNEVDLYPSEMKLVRQASCLIEQAMAPLKPAVRIDLLTKAYELLKQAITSMRV